jgi:AraC family transcriptional regulator, regulatory protein of adaptative response / DNA-3-methyladenine glycosylase II
MFTAVRTTGIYCQPDCGASPLPANTMGFDLAAAAEAAGFRPCLRCRPHRAPPPRIVTGSSVVCRAVSLVLDGALDAGTEDDLGRTLGVSGRQLRRLCRAELGVTPTDLARSVRAHFARRLLDDTDLAITEVAFAAGFTSVRQFNREMRRVFHRCPSDLRRTRRRRDRLVADGGLATRLPYDGDLDWTGLLRRHRPIPGVEVVHGDTYRRTIAVRRTTGVLELSAAEPGQLRLVLHLPHWEELVHLVRQVRRLLRLDEDPAERADRIGSWSAFERDAVQLLREVDPSDEALAVFVATAGAAVPGLSAWALTHTFPDRTPEATATLAIKSSCSQTACPDMASARPTVFRR